MTNTDKIIQYYQQFDEWGRLDTYPGQLEFQIALDLIAAHTRPPESVLDLGGGAGRYTYALAQRGYQLHLADLSPDLINTARQKLSSFAGAKNVKSIQVLNAVDLSGMDKAQFDHVLLFGPLYHLTTSAEIKSCLQEVFRVLKPNGKLFAAYIPYHCGLISILDRSFRAPDQVRDSVLSNVFTSGVFNNSSRSGFQEGNYLKTADLSDLLQEIGFRQLALRSIRGIGYTREKEMIELQEKRPEYYREVMHILHQTAGDSPILETSGHALYIGEKPTP